MTARPLDAARDALIALQGQLIALLAAQMTSLAGAADLRVAASHQEVEIPEMAARVIQHDLHAVACRRGQVHQAPAPAGT